MIPCCEEHKAHVRFQSPLSQRHSRCLKPTHDDSFKETHTKIKIGIEQRESRKRECGPLAQIRSLPLCLSQLRQNGSENSSDKKRSFSLHRSSYIVNSMNVKIPNKRTRSLSPEILKSTGVEPLQSPTLVQRSSSFPRKRSHRRSGGSLIPVLSLVRKGPNITTTTTIAARQCNPTTFNSTEKREAFKVNQEKEKYQEESPRVSNHQEKVFQRHDDELGGIIPSGGRKAHVRSFGSQLLGGGAGGSAPSSRRESSTSANGHNRRRMKMDIHSAPPRAGVARVNTAAVAVNPPLVYSQTMHRKFPPDYPPYGYHFKTSSVASSIYSEPIHSRSSLPMKQGFFQHKSVFGRGPPPSSTMFDDDPGIMSEAETSSTGFRRGGKARSSLPVVRTPSKTLERPLGLVFLQYRTETKRALLPNEITSLDTVKALFVRSFPKQLTMEYLEAMNVKIYIHDSAKDMFYELEDLRDIRDRSVLRLFEPNVNGNGAVPSWDQDQSYFSEPEFDSEYQHQHIHKTKGSKTPPYLNYSYPIGATLPRVTRPYSPAPVPIKTSAGSSAPPKPVRQYPTLTKRPIAVPADPALYSPRVVGGQDARGSFPMSPPATYIPSDLRRNIYSTAENKMRNEGYFVFPEPAYVSSPERRFVEDPYYAQFPPPRSGSITPVIIDEEARFRMEHMERQLANLTGLVQKALVVQPPVPQMPPPTRLVQSSPLPRNILPPGATTVSVTPSTPTSYRDYIPTRDYRDDIDKQSSSSSASLQDDPVRPSADIHLPPTAVVTKAPKFGKEKSVSFSDDPPEHGKQHSPSQYPAEKPTKPAIKSTTLPRMSQDRVLKAAPSAGNTVAGVPKQTQAQQQQQSLVQPTLVNIPSHPYERQYYSSPRGEMVLNPEMFNQLRSLQKKAKELKGDVRVLRRSVQAQALTIKETIKDTYLKFKVVAMAGNDQWMQGDPEKSRIHREKEYYKQEMLKLDKDLEELESTVEELRSQVINKRTRVNMSDVENMALVLSKSSKSVADLKARFPTLQDSVKNALSAERDEMITEERFLKEEPERLEIALRRCKKLTGTLVTLKRLASVQEQRLPSQDNDSIVGGLIAGGGQPGGMATHPQMKSNNRDSSTVSGYSTPTGSILGTTSPVVSYGTGTAVGPENALDDLLNELDGAHHHHIPMQNKHRLEPPKRLPSYPSTESGSPVRSPLKMHPPLPPKPTKIPPPPPPRTSSKSPIVSPSIESSGGDSSESVNSQDGGGSSRLNQRHQELLRKQKQLQEQYNRLQMLQQRSTSSAGSPISSSNTTTTAITSTSPLDKLELKKTGSESNLRAKLGLEFSSAPTGSLSNINKPLYETDIL